MRQQVKTAIDKVAQQRDSARDCGPFGTSHGWWGWPEDEESALRDPLIVNVHDAIAHMQQAKLVLARDAAITAKLAVVNERLAAIEAIQTRQAIIASVHSPSLQVIKPINVSILYNGDDYVATFFDANISATGDTEQEAVWNLQDMLGLKFEHFCSLPEKSLGKIPTIQLRVLRNFIAKA